MKKIGSGTVAVTGADGTASYDSFILTASNGWIDAFDKAVLIAAQFRNRFFYSYFFCTKMYCKNSNTYY